MATKHSGIKAMFNQYYVKPGIVAKENGRLYNRLFDLRQEGDYIDFVSLDAETVEPLIGETAVFIKKIQSMMPLMRKTLRVPTTVATTLARNMAYVNQITQQQAA